MRLESGHSNCELLNFLESIVLIGAFTIACTLCAKCYLTASKVSAVEKLHQERGIHNLDKESDILVSLTIFESG
jgi:hypothetical protein